MSEASSLKKLADHPPDRRDGDVTSFVERNVSVIQAARSQGHRWTRIYLDAVADGCPSESVRYFTRAAKKALGLDAEAATLPEDNLDHPKSRAAGRASRGAGGHRPLAQIGAADAKASNATKRAACIDGPPTALTKVEQLGGQITPDSGAVVMSRSEKPSADKPAPPSVGATKQGSTEAPDGSVYRQYAEPRKPSAQRTPSPEPACWDSAAPGQRAMLLKDAE